MAISSESKGSVARSTRSRRRCALAIGLLAIGVLSAWAVVAFVRAKGPTPGQVEHRVRTALPISSAGEQAETWLRKEGIEFVSFTRTAVEIGSPAVRAGVSARPLGRTIRAIVRPVFTNLIFDGDVHVYLFFDPDDHLIGYDLEPMTWAL